MTYDISLYELVLYSFLISLLILGVPRSHWSREYMLLLGAVSLIGVSKLALLLEGYAIFYFLSGTGFLLLSGAFLLIAGKLGKLKEVQNVSFKDPLTGAYNRMFVEEVVRGEILKSKRLEKGFCILLIDLNDFKQVNDRYGHKAGDEVLKIVVQRLKRKFRDYDMIARWGGDEFLIFLPCEEHHYILEVVDRVINTIRIPYRDVVVTASVGYACYPQDGETLSELIEIADKRMYKSKTIIKEVKKYALDNKGKKEV